MFDGSPAAAIDALAGNGIYSGGTTPDFHRIPWLLKSRKQRLNLQKLKKESNNFFRARAISVFGLTRRFFYVHNISLRFALRDRESRLNRERLRHCNGLRNPNSHSFSGDGTGEGGVGNL